MRRAKGRVNDRFFGMMMPTPMYSAIDALSRSERRTLSDTARTLLDAALKAMTSTAARRRPVKEKEKATVAKPWPAND